MPHATAPTRITVAPGGPYIVEEVSELTGADGQPMSFQPRMALYRCGKSANKPFCDGAHAARVSPVNRLRRSARRKRGSIGAKRSQSATTSRSARTPPRA
jgi:CDGSH-type Zn-finger protein